MPYVRGYRMSERLISWAIGGALALIGIVTITLVLLIVTDVVYRKSTKTEVCPQLSHLDVYTKSMSCSFIK